MIDTKRELPGDGAPVPPDKWTAPVGMRPDGELNIVYSPSALPPSPIELHLESATFTDEEARVVGALFGTALGDALGAPVEFMSYDEITGAYNGGGPGYLHPDHCRVTDDTQMALAVARALLAVDPEASEPALWEEPLIAETVRWLEDPQNNRAPGQACLSAARGLQRGEAWLEATTRDSKGCGANMRVAPVAMRLWREEDRQQRSRVAQLQAALTHGHPTALAAADATAFVIAALIRGRSPQEAYADVLAYTAPGGHPAYHADWLGELWKGRGFDDAEAFMALGWSETHAALQKVGPAVAGDEGEGDLCVLTGAGWIAEEALATAMFALLAHADEDAEEVIIRAAATSGDSDSIAAIAGALAGAHFGIRGLPWPWLRVVEYGEALAEIGLRFVGEEPA